VRLSRLSTHCASLAPSLSAGRADIAPSGSLEAAAELSSALGQQPTALASQGTATSGASPGGTPTIENSIETTAESRRRTGKRATDGHFSFPWLGLVWQKYFAEPLAVATATIGNAVEPRKKNRGAKCEISRRDSICAAAGFC